MKTKTQVLFLPYLLFIMLYLISTQLVVSADTVLSQRQIKPSDQTSMTPGTTRPQAKPHRDSPQPIGDYLVYNLKVPIMLNKLHKKITSASITCYLSLNPFDSSKPNIVTGYVNDSDHAGSGVTHITIDPELGRYRGTVTVTVNAVESKPPPKYYRCAITFKGGGPFSWDSNKGSADNRAAPNAAFKRLVEGTLP